MKKIYLNILAALLLLFSSLFANAQVTVSGADAATNAGSPYTTLGAAFTSINATAQLNNNIVISLTGNTTETATATLNAGTWATVNITATVPVVISGTIGGAVIRLNGADNVTIDGRIGGTGRNITVINNTTAPTAAGIASIWLSSTGAGAGAINNVIRNLEISGGATLISNANESFGIIMCGSTISVTADGNDNDNNSFIANRIIRARYGIVTRGTTTNLNINPIVTDNIIGPTVFGITAIGKIGIFMQADQGATVSRNTVQFVGGNFANTVNGTDRIGIAIGVSSWNMGPLTLTSNTYTVTNNIIHDVIEERTNSALGILLGTTGNGAATNNLVANNFIYNIKANGTSGDQTVGIGISGGHSDKVVHNSIYLSGDVDPSGSATASTMFGSGIRIANPGSASHANLTLMNNVISMDLSSSSTPANRYYAISGNFNTYSFGTGGENYNDYYLNPANTQLMIGGLGDVSGNTLAAQFATLANWKTAYTVPQDANSIQTNPNFVSATDLHIAAGASKLESVGASTAVTGVTTDIDLQLRPGPVGSVNGGATAPDLGADEFDGIPVDVTAPTIAFTPLSSCGTGNRTLTATITDPSGVPVSGSGLPVLYFRVNGGAYSPVQGVSIGGNQYTFTFGGGTVLTDVLNYYVVAQDMAPAINVGSNPSAGAGGFTANPPAAATPPSSPYSYTVGATLSGTYSVGIGGAYTTLTAAVNAYNSTCILGNLVFELTDATYPSETFPIVFNANPDASAANTLTIRPASGVTTLISGSNNIGIFKINGGDFITIDGSNSGGTSKDLTIQNNNTATTSTVIWVASTPTDGATNNNIRNIITKGGGPANTLGSIVLSGSSIGIPAERANANTSLTNNTLTKTRYGFYIAGSTTPQTGILVSDNTIGSSTASDYIGSAGIFISNSNAAKIIKNNIFNVVSNTSNPIGIEINSGVINSRFDGNRIDNVTSPFNFGGKGFDINTGNPNSSDTLSNNMISNIGGNGWNDLRDDGISGIRIGTRSSGNTNTGGISLFYNTINLTGSFIGGVSGNQSAALFLSSTASSLNIRNNIFVNRMDNTQSASDRSWAIHTLGTSGAFTAIDYNDYAVSGPAGMLGFINAADRPTLADIQAGFGMNAASVNTLPVFAASGDLHLDPVAPTNFGLDNSGTPITGVTMDFDAALRNGTTPDLGADEFIYAGVVPVTIEYFRGSKIAGANFLDWKVNCTSEPYVMLSLERSADGRNFKSIYDQNATAVRCQQGFSFTDNSPLAGVNYYRLKTTTADGKFRYSIIVALINREKGFELISISPNPVKINATLSVSTVKGGILHVSVTDVTGKVVMKQSLTVIAGNNPVNMNFSKLGAGTYSITVMNAEHEIKSTRFVKY